MNAKVPTTPAVLAAWTALESALRAAYGIDYTYMIMGHGRLIAASNHVNGIVEPYTADGTVDANEHPTTPPARPVQLPINRPAPAPITYEVIVGNIGTVYTGPDEGEAKRTYAEYVRQSKTNRGRAGREPVTLFEDSEISREYPGTLEE